MLLIYPGKSIAASALVVEQDSKPAFAHRKILASPLCSCETAMDNDFEQVLIRLVLESIALARGLGYYSEVGMPVLLKNYG